MRWGDLTLVPDLHYRRRMGSLQRAIALVIAILVGQVAVAQTEDVQKA